MRVTRNQVSIRPMAITPSNRRLAHPLRRVPSNFSEVQQADITTMTAVFTRCSALYRAIELRVKGTPQSPVSREIKKTDAYIALNASFIAAKALWTPAREAYNSLRLNPGRTADEMAAVIAQFTELMQRLEAISK